jgi:hypothetical protein
MSSTCVLREGIWMKGPQSGNFGHIKSTIRHEDEPSDHTVTDNKAQALVDWYIYLHIAYCGIASDVR